MKLSVLNTQVEGTLYIIGFDIILQVTEMLIQGWCQMVLSVEQIVCVLILSVLQYQKNFAVVTIVGFVIRRVSATAT